MLLPGCVYGGESCSHILTITLSARALVLACCQWKAAAGLDSVLLTSYTKPSLPVPQRAIQVSLPLHHKASMADQTDAAAVLQGKLLSTHQPSMFSPDHIPALMSANLKSWVLLISSVMLMDIFGVMSLPSSSCTPCPSRCAVHPDATWTHVHANVVQRTGFCSNSGFRGLQQGHSLPEDQPSVWILVPCW